MSIKTVIQILIGVAGYVTWAVMAWFDPAIRPDFLKFNVAMAIGTIGLVLRDMRPADSAQPPDKQSGSASLLLMAILSLGALALSGCASLNFAGNASYSVEPFLIGPGNAVCCKVLIQDGKERASLDLHVVKDGDKYDITLSEKQVTAFAGQQIAANAGIANAEIAAKAATAVILAPLAPALIGSGGVGAAAAGAGAATLLTPSGVKP